MLKQVWSRVGLHLSRFLEQLMLRGRELEGRVVDDLVSHGRPCGMVGRDMVAGLGGTCRLAPKGDRVSEELRLSGVHTAGG